MVFNTPATAPYGLYVAAINANSKQNVVVSEAFSFESTSTRGATPATFSSEAGGSIDAQLKDLTINTALLTKGINATASGAGSATHVAITGNINTDIQGVGQGAALLYTSNGNNAQGATIDFTGGGTLMMPDGALMASLGTNALINVHPTQATELTGLGYAAYNGKIDFRLTQKNQIAQMTMQPDQATGGVIDMTLDNEAQWLAIGPTSHVKTLTLNRGGTVDMRLAQGADESTDLGQAYLYAKRLEGDGGIIALNVNTASHLGQILVIEEASTGNHTLLVHNQPDAIATGVPIKVVESVGGETSDAFKATFKEATPPGRSR